MQVHFLGTGGFHANARRQTAGVLLPEIGLLFDAGSGLFRLPARLQTDELTVLLSHAHLDHIVGLPSLLVPLLTGRLQRCCVYAAPAVLQAVQEHLFAAPVFPVMPPRLEWRPLPDQLTIGDCQLSWTTLVHPGGSLGFRLNRANGRSLAYITDTTVDGSYSAFVHGVDVLIHECYFPDRDAALAVQTGHSHTSQVAHLARQAQVQHLWLTHIDPQQPGDDPIELSTARQIFPRVSLAEDELSFDW
jgi:ribonuclease Z